MKDLWKRFWTWCCALFKTTADGPFSDLKPPKEEKYRGTLIWDSRRGTYRRRAPKIGRNASCPCGKVRIAPCDETKTMKYKFCCGVIK